MNIGLKSHSKWSTAFYPNVTLKIDTMVENVHKQLSKANRLLYDTLSILRRHVRLRVHLFLQITVSYGKSAWTEPLRMKHLSFTDRSVCRCCWCGACVSWKALAVEKHAHRRTVLKGSFRFRHTYQTTIQSNLNFLPKDWFDLVRKHLFRSNKNNNNFSSNNNYYTVCNRLNRFNFI